MLAAQVAVNATSIYWTNTKTNTIGRANIDGTGVDQALLTSTPTGPYNGPNGIAATNNHVFYSAGNVITRANPDGTSPGAFYSDEPGATVGRLGLGPSTLYFFRNNGATAFGTGAVGLDQSSPSIYIGTDIIDGVTGTPANVYTAATIRSSTTYPIRSAGLDRQNPQVLVPDDAKRKTGLVADKCSLYFAEVAHQTSGGAFAGTIAKATYNGAVTPLVTTDVLDPQGIAVDQLGPGGSSSCTPTSTDGGSTDAPPTQTQPTVTTTVPQTTPPPPPPPTTGLPTAVPTGGFTRPQVDALLHLALDYIDAHAIDPFKLQDPRYQIAKIILTLDATDTEWCGIGGCVGLDPFSDNNIPNATIRAADVFGPIAAKTVAYARIRTTPRAGTKRVDFATAQKAMKLLISADKALTSGNAKVAKLARARKTKAVKKVLAKAKASVKTAKRQLATLQLTTVKLKTTPAGKVALKKLVMSAKQGKTVSFTLRMTLRDQVSGATASASK